MKVRIKIDGPGSSGELVRNVTTDEANVLEWLAREWNEENGNHSQPTMTVELVDDGGSKLVRTDKWPFVKKA